MDFLENKFKKLWKTKRQKSLASDNVYQLKDIQTYIETLLSYANKGNETLMVKSTLQSVGVSGGLVFLPEFVDFFINKDENKKIYFYLALKCLALNKLNKKLWPVFDSKIAGGLFCLSHIHLMNRWLDHEFSFFKEFQKDYIKTIMGTGLVAKNNTSLFWQKRIFAREPMDSADELTLKILLSVQKKNDRVPNCLLFTTPSYLGEANLFIGAKEGDVKRNKSEKKAEQESQRGALAKKQELDKKKDNPVTHSFEKLETVDEYEGGNRFDSGDDELEKHKDALDEIELNNVTIGGESSSSIYKTDSHLSGQFLEKEQKMKSQAFLYSEWNEKKATYIKDYCTLNVTTVEKKQFSTQRALLKQKFHKELFVWKKKLIHLFNKPLWKNQLPEGDEIEMDRWCRVVADLSVGQTPDYNIYSAKKIKEKEIAIALLFDQSLSTDSWIENHRVIDVIGESLGVTGLLLEDMTKQFLIAGTYSATHNNCQLRIYKDFNDPWSSFYPLIKGIEPMGYTRLGPAIRHLNELLKKVSAKKKILIIITDGRPTDLDHYEGSHGINDIRKSVFEAEASGNRVVAITLDKHLRPHFKKMFTRFEMIKSPDKFSESLFKLLYQLFK